MTVQLWQEPRRREQLISPLKTAAKKKKKKSSRLDVELITRATVFLSLGHKLGGCGRLWEGSTVPTMPIQDFVSSLTDNPYFSAGFGLFGVGAGAAVLRKGYMLGLIMFRRHYMTTLEVPCRDKSYQWLLQWITLRGAKKTQHLSVETTFQQIETGRITTRHDFIPSVGEHFFWYGGTWLKVERTREQHTIDLQHGTPWENIQFTAFGKQKQLFHRIICEGPYRAYQFSKVGHNSSTTARDLAVKQNEGKTIMYTAYGSEWRQFGNPRKPRPLTSVILDEGISERILKDVQDFMNNPEWYSNRGNTIILLEDIDSAFANREETAEVKAAYAGMNRLTFSGLLNCLDGVASSEARMVFMTTNYPERLDPALVRPGRVDLKEYIGHCTPHQLVTMYRRFYPETPVESAFSFSEVVRDLKVPVSAAAVQGHFMQHKEDPLGALDNSSSLNHVYLMKEIVQ
ncbi:Mitochondrial chaperone BCS1 [Chionoecetes opilio]|uniref:Mitochondrial chaperone BCS1 n=1 Tax=Chionoecetes opilio TaxID=41210 RepID=A0A8J4YGM7_CHIOP|nr:Mitochondrial chaperone BCS1 [Chionoecetes opilio]